MAYYVSTKGPMMQVMTDDAFQISNERIYPVGAQLMEFIYYDAKEINDALDSIYLESGVIVNGDPASALRRMEDLNVHLRWFGEKMASCLIRHNFRTRAGFAAICKAYPEEVTILKSLPQWQNVIYKTVTKGFLIGIFGLQALTSRQQLQDQLEFCLNSTQSDTYQRLNPAQRLLVYEQWRRQQDVQPYYFDTDLYVTRMVVSYPVNWEPAASIEAFSAQVEARNPTVREMAYLADGPALQRFELMKLITLGIPVKRCANCHRYFLPEGRSDMEYCSRPVKDQPERTCQDVGALRKYEQKVRDNPVYTTHRQAYKRMNSRVRTGSLTQAEFLIWSEQARELREQCLAGRLSLAEYADWLDKERKYKKKD